MSTGHPHISDALVVIDSMSQQRLSRMAALAQEALGGKRKARAVLASLREMALELQNDINFAAETVGFNYTTREAAATVNQAEKGRYQQHPLSAVFPAIQAEEMSNA